MPRGFSGHSAASVDVWLPLSVAMRSDPGWSENPFRNVVSVFARLGDSSTVPAATEQAAAVLNRGVALRSVSGLTVGSTERKIAIWLTAVSLLVLAIGLANAATLLLVRSIKRSRIGNQIGAWRQPRPTPDAGCDASDRHRDRRNGGRAIARAVVG
jgi:hypothetical protein